MTWTELACGDRRLRQEFGHKERPPPACSDTCLTHTSGTVAFLESLPVRIPDSRDLPLYQFPEDPVDFHEFIEGSTLHNFSSL